MLRFAFAFLLLLFAQVGLSQDKSVRLKTTGIPFEKQNQIQQFADSTSAFKALNTKLKALQLSGYFDINLDNTYFTNDTLFAEVALGPQYKGLKLENGNISTLLINDLGLKNHFQQNRSIPLGELSKTYHTVLNYFQNNGYPFAQVWLDSLTERNTTLQAKLFVNPGKEITIDTLRLVGSGKLTESFLSSYLTLKKNDLYSEEKVKNIAKRLNNLSFITLPKPPEIVFSGDDAKINLFIDKQNANQFDGILGFLPNAQTGNLQLTGDFKLNLKNALKSGETLDFNYRGLPAQAQELNLAIHYPYLFKTQLGLSGSFQLFKRDTSFLNLNSRLGFEYDFSLTKQIGFFLENFNGNQISDVQSVGIPVNANINARFYGLTFAFVNLDSKTIPHKGADFHLAASVGQRRMISSQNFDPSAYFDKIKSQQFKVQADLKYYLKLGARSVLYARNLSAILTGNSLFENEAFRIGGAKTLRGFDEQSFNVNSFSVQSTEFRYFIERNSFLNLFYDQAYISQNFINQQSTDYPLGIGAGITFQTKIGITSLSYAIGKQKNIPLDLQKGKIHIGVLSYF